MVKIISDSTCDLSPELLERYDVSILPLHIVLGDREFLDGKNITPDEIYAWADQNQTTPKTSAPSMEDAVELMRPYVEAGQEIVCFAISEDMSTSANVMRIAADELDASNQVFVINSQNLSTGIGLLVIEAAILAKEGKNGARITEAIEKLIPQVRASFVVDTLEYLYRGGRCSGVAAFVGGAFKLHPTIVVENGKMLPTRKYRGKMSSVLMNYAADREADLHHARKQRVFITHSGCDEKLVDSVKTYLENLHLFEEVLITRAGGVISSHCGPGTLGILYILDEEQTDA